LTTTNESPPVGTGIADPGPLGLAAFALTTFLLSVKNANWMNDATGLAWLPYALAYGGLTQLLAGMWEFRNRNVFGATAFGTYGAFWIGLALWVRLVAAAAPPPGVGALVYAALTGKDLAWIVLAFAIFNTYMLIWSSMVNVAIFGVFLTLEVTEILLVWGGFAANSTIIHWGGYIGVVTAAVAWYTSAGLVVRGMSGRELLPLGKPFLKV
jgi:succinate-acetate transporter protein